MSDSSPSRSPGNNVPGTTPFASYKGFDLYPLVYRNRSEQAWPRTRPDNSFQASIVICREGYRPGEDHARVFPLGQSRWENIGSARRGALQFGEDIINGLVAGESVASL
ncbi:conserved hypothetical protein [Cupriavidus taiwanensis]|uniref:Uncharacterized protein n=1 Tax=Cupriavidus taiwanensis TaxID=164546 RepID=A0A375E7U1_9BURK|nr:hypothetical protein [Cupriavidus taiwanensis]SOZ18096.1 conserved hypothetical protein [Cupriavidus taiwanensis]SOZ31058.1 conserved hypothetical protein [Cupriavidus taiwanensis]SOZ47135.1 conserved hypothetical protein [Cupriavidus taiwanensis]SOZ66166.1 conserved hypothetical protein [Cupriavidus taiwanensis]SOZ67086.1 conserved hypothetical protein [Cupriavidus taiwanensis]